MATVQFYTRRGCHLCELMLEELLPLLRGRAAIDICDIDTDPKWRQKYDIRVPILEFNGNVIGEYPLELDAVRRALVEIGILRR